MANEKIRKEMRAYEIYMWQIAEKLGVCEQTIIRWFRVPLSDNKLEKINKAISELKSERNAAQDTKEECK